MPGQVQQSCGGVGRNVAECLARISRQGISLWVLKGQCRVAALDFNPQFMSPKARASVLGPNGRYISAWHVQLQGSDLGLGPGSGRNRYRVGESHIFPRWEK